MIEKVKINKIFANPVNPRTIKENKFKKLVNSIKEFPEMLKLRPIVVNSEMGILGGNMRYKACQQLGLKEVWIIKAENLTEKQMQQFVIKDNVGFGEWDWDILANSWDTKELKDWGIDVWQPEEVIDYSRRTCIYISYSCCHLQLTSLRLSCWPIGQGACLRNRKLRVRIPGRTTVPARRASKNAYCCYIDTRTFK